MTTLPASPWATRFAVIRAVTSETPGVWTFDLEFDDTAPYSFRPGQFNMLYLPGVGESAISMSSDPAEPANLRHTIRAVGNVTRAMERLGVGDRIGIRGPFGTAWPVDEYRGKDVVLVAGGIGLAPLRPAIYHLLRHRADYGKVTLVYGARKPVDLLYTNEYEAWRTGGMDVQVTVDVASPDWQGPVGVVTVPLNQLPLEPGRTGVFTCGPDIMMRFVAEAAIKRGVAASDVHVSLERNMNCAIGLCGHCQIGAEFTCKDGPVFPFSRVRHLMLVENF